MSNKAKDEEMICALTADEYGVLQRELQRLPETMPPRDVWHRIRAQAEAEGLLNNSHGRSRWYWGASLAAACAMAAIIANVITNNPTPTSRIVPEMSAGTTNQIADLTALMVESRQLENDLRSLPSEPRVAQAGTVATIADLEDRIAAIDYQLNNPREQLSPEDREIFWRERVRMMKLLLQLRYAQAQRAAY